MVLRSVLGKPGHLISIRAQTRVEGVGRLIEGKREYNQVTIIWCVAGVWRLSKA
jgi:hypothetical protein